MGINKGRHVVVASNVRVCLLVRLRGAIFNRAWIPCNPCAVWYLLRLLLLCAHEGVFRLRALL
eukprot:5661684-Prorocentrum_lima.AAC.1